MNKLANLKAQIYREKRRLFRLTLFKKNRVKFPQFIQNPKQTMSQSNKSRTHFGPNPHKLPDSSTAQGKIVAEKIGETKPISTIPKQSRIKTNKQDICILLNEMYAEDSNELLLILAIKLANVLLQLDKDGVLGEIKKDFKFMQILNAQIFSENFICFLSQPFDKIYIARNQLRCLEIFSSLFCFEGFFNTRGYILRRLVSNLFQKYNASEHIILKLQILHNFKCLELKNSLALVVQETLTLLIRSIEPHLGVGSQSLDYQVYETTSQVVYEVVSLWEEMHGPSSQLAEDGPLLSVELESVLLGTSCLIEHVLEFLVLALTRHLEQFQSSHTKSLSSARPLVYLFSFLYRLVELDAGKSPLIDFTRCLAKYLDVVEMLNKDFVHFEDGFKEFLLLLNSLVVRHSQSEDCRFDFEIFHLMHGPKFFRCFKLWGSGGSNRQEVPDDGVQGRNNRVFLAVHEPAESGLQSLLPEHHPRRRHHVPLLQRPPSPKRPAHRQILQ